MVFQLFQLTAVAPAGAGFDGGNVLDLVFFKFQVDTLGKGFIQPVFVRWQSMEKLFSELLLSKWCVDNNPHNAWPDTRAFLLFWFLAAALFDAGGQKPSALRK